MGLRRNPSRRVFLQTTGALAATAAATAWARPAWAGAAGANEKVVMGVIGPGGQGSSLLGSFVTLPGVEIAWVCDVDERRMRAAADHVKKHSRNSPKQAKDLRKVLDDKAVDAVIVATPDHWHAPATILACDAGKHVYVEKPASHNLREGRLMVEAARRHKRVVQVGTQSRSVPHVIEAMQLIRDGAIGDVLASKAWNSQKRGDIGRRKPEPPPAYLDYDAWVGPAPMVPYQSNLLPGVWRWWHNFGCGDIGNDGVHDIDLARWGLGVETHPSTVAAIGGKYFFDDDQQFPDTQYVVYQYENAGLGKTKPKQLVYEQRLWSPYVQEGAENGNAFYGTEGALILSKKNGWKLYEPGDNEQSAKPKKTREAQFDSVPHHRNFLECIRSGTDANRSNADIEIGHLSSSLAHLGNIATRVGRTIRFDPKAEKVLGDDQANKLVGREYRSGHWAVPKGAVA
jgi:predicted dehydrogenase